MINNDKLKDMDRVSPVLMNGEGSIDSAIYCSGDKDSGIIAVSQGMSWSCSSVLRFSPKSPDRIKSEIIQSLLPEYAANAEKCGEHFKEWFNKQISFIGYEDYQPSLLWFSTSLLIRLVYYLLVNKDGNLKSKKERQKAVDFIYSGARKLADLFESETGGIYKHISPSTLAFAKYSVLDSGEIKAEVVWSGNSRVYAYIPGKGLRRLTKDDTDSSGRLSNCFWITKDDKFETKLHYRSFILPEKCVIFVCDSGLYRAYGPRDGMGVKTDFLRAVDLCADFTRFNTNWLFHYQKNTGNFASLAFGVFGYRYYYEFKKDVMSEFEDKT